MLLGSIPSVLRQSSFLLPSSASGALWPVGCRLFSLHMPIPSVVMHRRVHLGAKEENRRRDVKVKEQREGDAQASVDNAVVGEVRQVERETQRG